MGVGGLIEGFGSKVGASVEVIGDLVECGLLVGSTMGVGGLIEGFSVGAGTRAMGGLTGFRTAAVVVGGFMLTTASDPKLPLTLASDFPFNITSK